MMCNFDSEQAWTRTIIGIGTAFSILALLALLTSLLRYIDSKLGLTKSEKDNTLQKSPGKDKALAAAIAVSLALESGSIQPQTSPHDYARSETGQPAEEHINKQPNDNEY